MKRKQWVEGIGTVLGGAAGYIRPGIDPTAAALAMGVGVMTALSATEYPQQLLSEALEKGELAPKEA